MKLKTIYIIILTILIISTGIENVHAVVGGTTIGGCIYEGSGSVTYTMDAMGEPVPNWSTNYTGNPVIANGQVMVQDQQADGAFVVYGTMGLDATGMPVEGGNCWEAAIPDLVNNTTGLAGADGVPDATDLIVMFSAPGHDSTSREFTWNAVSGEFTHPNQTGGIVGLVNGAGAESTGAQNAYLPPLDANGNLPTANLLHYVFYDNFVNSGDNGPIIDPGLNGVTVRVLDLDGNVVATQITGELAFNEGGFMTKDGMPFVGPAAYGYVYFQGLPGGKEYKVVSDPSTVTQADNPHMQLRLAHAGTPGSCVVGVYGYGDGTNCQWYQNYTEEGGHEWSAFLWPGDPGTEAGFYMTWHAFFEKVGNDGGCNPLSGICGSISGTLMDADGNDPEEPFPQTGGGRVPPTNARYEDGTVWNINGNPDLGINEELGGPPVILPDTVITMDYMPNARIPEAIVALYTAGGGIPRLVATTEATQPTYFNSPGGGDFTFVNVPPGSYEIFTFDRDLVNVPTIGTQVDVVPGSSMNLSILNPRFMARGVGFVMNNGVPVSGATVKVQFKGGATQRVTTTNAGTGWFRVDNLPETGSLGKFYVDMQDGDTFRGKIITETFQREGTGCIDPNTGLPVIPCMIYTDTTHNAMSRLVQWWTLNYFVDLQVETIPADVGNLMGVVFYDSLEMGTLKGNGLWEEAHETTFGGETVELYSAIPNVDGITFDCPDLSAGTAVPDSIASTGTLDLADAAVTGWPPAGTWPPNEIGGVFGGPVVCPECTKTAGTPEPAVGFYEFRDMAPGSYCVRVAPKTGFRNSPDTGNGLHLLTVTGGVNSRVDIGINATPTAAAGNCGAIVAPATTSTCSNNTDYQCATDADCENLPSPFGGVAMSGLMEGGVFSGLWNLDPNPMSTMFDEAMNIVGSPVAVYDQFNYLLGVMYMTDAWCNSMNNMFHVPGTYPADPYACSSAAYTIQPPEVDRRFAPGVYRYSGNDSNFTQDPALPAGDKTLGYNPVFDTMELGAGMEQAGIISEFAWTPLQPLTGGATSDICVIGLAGTDTPAETWGASVTVKVSDGFTMIQNVQVVGSWSTAGSEKCITNVAGECSISIEKVEPGDVDFVRFDVTDVRINNQSWYVYNPATTGILAGTCKTSVIVYNPAYIPPPPAPECSDGIDNDGDGLVDFPTDPGCVSGNDNAEFNDPPPSVQCSDGIDNDGDGLVDFPADAGCLSATDNDEFNAPPIPAQCADGIDNDGDGLVDFPDDPGCLSVDDDDEFNIAPPPPPVLEAVIVTPAGGGEAMMPFELDGRQSTGNIVSYDWTFGDGNIGVGAIATHTYSTEGTYSVTLTVTSDTGAVSTAIASIVIIPLVEPPPPGPTGTVVHVGDLNGYPSYREGKLTGNVTITVVDSAGNRIPDASVYFTWEWTEEGKAKTATGMCFTDGSGECSAASKELENVSSVDFIVDNILDEMAVPPALPTLIYDERLNVVDTITVP